MVHFVDESRCFLDHAKARRLAAASPLSNLHTQHVCWSVQIAQGLSESMGPELELIQKFHVGAQAHEAHRMNTGLVCSPRL